MPKKEPVTITTTKITVRGMIVTTVISLLGALILGYWQFIYKPNQLSESTNLVYVGRVIDTNNQLPIPGAKITLYLNGIPKITYTDSDGVYQFNIAGYTGNHGQIRVDAQGYQVYTRSIQISSDQNTIEDIRLAFQSSTSIVTQGVSASESPSVTVTEFFDNFDHGIDSAIWRVDLTEWNGTNGMASASEIYSGAKIFLGDLSWKDYKITVNTSSSNGERTSYVAAVYVRYQDENNFVQFVFDCDFPASTIIWQYKKFGNLSQINTTSRELSTCKFEPYIIQLRVQGSNYQAKIDGEDVTFSLDLFENGLVGLYSGENGGGASAAFDNFLIEP